MVQVPSGSDEDEQPKRKGKAQEGKLADKERASKVRAQLKKGKKSGADPEERREAAELELLLLDDEKLRCVSASSVAFCLVALSPPR